MNFSIKSGSPEKQRTGCLLTGIYEGRRLSPSARLLDRAAEGQIAAVLRRGDIQGKLGQTLLLHNLPGIAAERVLLVGCGRENELGDRHYRKLHADAYARVKDTGSQEVTSYLCEVGPGGRDIYWCVRHAVEVAGEALYRFDRMKSKKSEPVRGMRRMVIAVADRGDQERAAQALADGSAIAAGVHLARDLGNLPPNVCTPSYLADQARELGRTHKRIKVRVLGEKEMRELGMGALLAVARGSRQEPQLLVLEYWGHGRREAQPIVLIGKGVTFDSGGISLKPAEAMDEMKFDMCGAASVLGAMSAVAELQLPLNVIGLAPATENLPGGNATKPGDIVTSMSGQTVEILNTDAEGRLILCDTLTYAERYKPELAIDIATLTGACVVALGKHATGLFANHAPLATELLEAARYSVDLAWQLPLWDEYQPQLDSNFADMANIGGREAGAVTAACFLSRFAKQFHWAHLDIAGTAWRSGKEKGATGRPVPLLMQFLIDRARSVDRA